MSLQKLYWNRYLVYGVLIALGSLSIIEALPQYTLLHGKLKNIADPVLDVTGLWQGSWDLFAPTPDYVNVRVGATLFWSDGSRTFWVQPNWYEMSPGEKMLNFRRMSYFDELWRSSNSAAWEPFCEHLAKSEGVGKSAQVTKIALFQDRDVIALPSDTWRAASSEPQFEIHSKLITWFADE